jgi:hypothetical protein
LLLLDDDELYYELDVPTELEEEVGDLDELLDVVGL